MFRWILAVTLCLFLAEGSQIALAQNAKGEAVSSGRGAGAAVKSSPARSGTSSRPSLRATTRPSSSKAVEDSKGKPGKDDGQRPGRPGKPGSKPGGKPGSKPGHGGKPGYDGKPGRPGDNWNRPHRSRWDRCYPNCYYGSYWTGSGRYYYDDDYYEEEDTSQQMVVQEPPTYFSPGQFEFFEDPRLNWAAEGGLGSATANSPPPPGTMPSSPRQTESDLKQYEQMMKTWR